MSYKVGDSRSELVVAIRADASRKIGTGHVMRCLTLAISLVERGAKVHLLCADLPLALEGSVASAGVSLHRIEPSSVIGTNAINSSGHGHLDYDSWLAGSPESDAAACIEFLTKTHCDWLVVDHYALDVRWEALVKPLVGRMLVIDDLANRSHDCDVLLDQNLYIDNVGRYQGLVSKAAKVFIGPKFALLRKQFSQARENSVVPRTEVRRIFVFLGGADAANHTYSILCALVSYLDPGHAIHVDVVIGGGHHDLENIERLCSNNGFECHVQTSRMAELMSLADLAIGAGGSATWERCCLGLPSLTIVVAENQYDLVKNAALEGVLLPVGVASKYEAIADADALAGKVISTLDGVISNPHFLCLMSSRGASLVDGNGAARVARQMGFSLVSTRIATLQDSDSVFEWRNHEDVRFVSRSPLPIARADHDRWFVGVIEKSDRLLLIGSIGAVSIGVIRFDIESDEAEVSIYLVPGASRMFSDLSLGAELLVASERHVKDFFPEVASINAEVLNDNPPSHGLFMSLDYKRQSTTYSKVL